MKKYLLGLFAVVLAVGFSAFTVKKVAPKQTTRFAVYQLATQVGEINAANYVLQTSQPAVCPDPSGIVCWFSVSDLNADGLINSTDVALRADQLDTDNDNIINDNQVEVPNVYNEKP